MPSMRLDAIIPEPMKPMLFAMVAECVEGRCFFVLVQMKCCETKSKWTTSNKQLLMASKAKGSRGF